MRESLALPTQVVLDRPPETLLPVVCRQLSQRATALSIALRGDWCDESAAASGCGMAEESLLSLVSLVQVACRERSGETTLVKRLRGAAGKALEAMAQLLAMLADARRRGEVSPGTGLVWAALEVLEKFSMSSAVEIGKVLAAAEAVLADTVEEMANLPKKKAEESEEDSEDDEDDDDDGDDDEDDEGLDESEFARAECAVQVLKAARGVVKYASKAISESKETNAALLEEVARLCDALLRAAEELGCALYAPQDEEEVRKRVAATSLAVEQFCTGLAAVDPASSKMQAVSARICRDAAQKMEKK